MQDIWTQEAWGGRKKPEVRKGLNYKRMIGNEYGQLMREEWTCSTRGSANLEEKVGKRDRDPDLSGVQKWRMRLPSPKSRSR